MRLALISDVHANLEALRATLQAISAQDVDRIVCLGDIVGYNANPAECLTLLRDADALCVAGSHDRAVAGLITTEEFSSSAAQAVAWTRARLDADDLEFLAALPLQVSVQGQLVGVHGALLPEGGCDITRLNTEESRRTSFEVLAAHASGARICAFGHTHHLGLFELHDGVERALADDEVALRDDAFYLVNPGSVGQPRNTKDRRATYMLFDTVRRIITVHRVSYDFAKAMAKARKAGLVPAYYAIPALLRATLRRGARTLGIYSAAKRLAEAHQRRRRQTGTFGDEKPTLGDERPPFRTR